MTNVASFKALVAGAALACMSLLAAAEGFPAKPVRLVVPFPAGTATDQAARMVGQQLQAALGQPFVVDNKPGAGGSIAAMEVVRSNPDGYTLLFSSNSAISSNVALLKSIPYDPTKDFTPVAGVGDNALVLMVKPSFPAKDLKEFIAYVKSKPGKLSAGYGSSSSQVSISMLSRMAGLDVLPVPYKGIPLAVTDVLGGTLDFTFVDLGNALAQAKGGALRPIAVTSARRNPLVADWSTIAEAVPGYDISAWFAVVGPAGIPADVVDKLNAAITKVVVAPEMRQRFGTIGLGPMPMPPARLKSFIAEEIVKWRGLVKDAGIEPE